jgi:hypothetical protein
MQHDTNEHVRELLFRVAYKQLAEGDWKRLAHHWAFTAEQIRAIEHQYTGKRFQLKYFDTHIPSRGRSLLAPS